MKGRQGKSLLSSPSGSPAEMRASAQGMGGRHRRPGASGKLAAVFSAMLFCSCAGSERHPPGGMSPPKDAARDGAAPVGEIGDASWLDTAATVGAGAFDGAGGLSSDGPRATEVAGPDAFGNAGDTAHPDRAPLGDTAAPLDTAVPSDAPPPDARDASGGSDARDTSGRRDAADAQVTADTSSAIDATGTADVRPAGDAAGDNVTQPPFRVLLFSRTTGFRHASIPTALAALMQLQSSGGYLAEATEDPTTFTPGNLARFQVIVFALTSGEVLNPTQQAAFEGWVAAGGGYVGIHSASDTEFDWEFYGRLVGAYFRVHPAIQDATVRVEAPAHPIMFGIPTTWARRDEWYDFRSNPRPNVTVLATLDESTYSGGTMGADHPIAWSHPTTGGGRSFYTAMGHTSESYAEPAFRRHLLNGIRWVAGR